MKYDIWTRDSEGHAMLDHAGISAAEVTKLTGIPASEFTQGTYVQWRPKVVAIVEENDPRPIPEKLDS